MFDPESLAYKAPAKKRPRKKVVFGSLLGIVILAAAGWYSYGNLHKQFQPKPEPPQAKAPPPPPKEVLGLIESVEKQDVNLPNNEFPSVATIQDLDELSDQAFFNGAAIGDKLIIYYSAKRAYLFRPTENKVITQGRLEVVQDVPSEIPEQPVPASSEAVLRVKL